LIYLLGPISQFVYFRLRDYEDVREHASKKENGRVSFYRLIS